MAADGDKTVDQTVALVAVDASEYSEAALNWYINKLHRPEYKVTLLHVAEYPRLPVLDTRAITPELWHEEITKMKNRMDTLENSYAEKLKAKGVPGLIKVMVDCEPGAAIVHLAGEIQASFVVVGSRGVGTLRRTILGSTSDYVVHHAQCPVMVHKAASS